MDSKVVYVVHCVDTEGPLYEKSSVPFDMIENIFGIHVDESKENLEKLQNGEFKFGGVEKEIQKLVDKHRITTRGSWEEVGKMIDEVTSDEFRNMLPDSKNNGWIFNWFCMSHVGFTGENPRRRATGYHTISDYYKERIDKQQSEDIIGFHYHPVPISGNYHESGTAYWGGENISQILCRSILDRGWFPAVFRPGFHTERPDSNWFLEQWIPFDYANQSMLNNEEGQKDLSQGRFGDWRRASTEWYPYHPSNDDYQISGSCRRWITRCLNMYARTRQMEQRDVDDAFLYAREKGKAILAFTDHDYKDMEFEINRVRKMIEVAANRFPDVKFIYSNAVDAMRECVDLEYEEFDFDVNIVKSDSGAYLDVKVDNDIFGPQPYLAIKLKDGRYVWDNFDFREMGREWTYTFDNNTVNLSNIDKIGIASNNKCGFTKVVVLQGEKKKAYTYNVRRGSHG